MHKIIAGIFINYSIEYLMAVSLKCASLQQPNKCFAIKAAHSQCTRWVLQLPRLDSRPSCEREMNTPLIDGATEPEKKQNRTEICSI